MSIGLPPTESSRRGKKSYNGTQKSYNGSQKSYNGTHKSFRGRDKSAACGGTEPAARGQPIGAKNPACRG